MSLDGIGRHALVRLDPAAWAVALAARPELAGVPELAGWAARGRPLVARRRCAGDPPGAVALGLPLPPALGKARLAFAVAPEAVRAVDPPLPLRAARAAAPAGWHRAIDAALELSRGVAVFGSFAWSALTGLAYVTVASDLDLIWPLSPAIPDLLAALPALEAEAPGRLDGEVVAADGSAANWRELAGGAAAVLVKTLGGVTLVDRAAFLRGDTRRAEPVLA